MHASFNRQLPQKIWRSPLRVGWSRDMHMASLQWKMSIWRALGCLDCSTGKSYQWYVWGTPGDRANGKALLVMGNILLKIFAFITWDLRVAFCSEDKCTLAVLGPTVWNSQPVQLPCTQTHETFIQYIKVHLFQVCFTEDLPCANVFVCMCTLLCCVWWVVFS